MFFSVQKRLLKFCWLVLIGGWLSACSAVRAPLPSSTPSPLPPTPASSPTLTAAPRPTATPAPKVTSSSTPTPQPVTLIGAGDISICGQTGDDETAAILARYPQAAIFTTGDNLNEDVTLALYDQCFGPSWGQYLERIRPAAGNHDLPTYTASDYYTYFGSQAGEPGQGYYSYPLGDWHVVVLNSNCNRIDCGPDSAQLTWLRADLEANPSRCTLAYWHHPRFTSGLSGGGALYNFWDILYQHGVEIVINGHDHDYERFAPQNPLGESDPQNGIRQFVVGIGGASLRPWGFLTTNSEVFDSSTYGVLKLELASDRYSWELIPVGNQPVLDSGSTLCH